MPRVMVVAGALACVLAANVAVADPAAERAAAQRCAVAKSWCTAALTDPITLDRTPYTMLAAQEPILVRGASARVAWQIPCEAGRLELSLWSERLLTYSDILVRYRIDPGGFVGAAAARHASGGKSFVLDDGPQLIEVMKRGTKLTAELTLPLNIVSGPATFNVSGLAEALRRINCGG